MSDDKVKEKLGKVLALLEGAQTEGEANAAALKLQELLAKYNLSMSEIAGDEGGDEVEERKIDCGTSNQLWKLELAQVIAHNFRCEMFMNRCGRRKSAVLVGEAQDVEIAVEVVNAAVKAAMRLFRKWSAKAKADYELAYGFAPDTSKAVFRNGYYFGFVEGMRKAYEEQLANDGELAIVLQTPAVVKAYMDGLGLGKGRKSKPVAVDEGAYCNGRDDGYGYGSCKRIAAA